jgi:inhibitor of cysteine peptidase
VLNMERKRFVLLAGLVLALASAVWSDPAQAALCSKCRDLMFIDSVGVCKACSGQTTSGALQLCAKCSAQRHQCEHCLAATTAADEKAAESRPADPAPENAGAGDFAPKPPLVWKPSSDADKTNGSAPPQPAPPETSPTPAANTGAAEKPTPAENLPEGKPPAELPPESTPATKLKPIHPAKAGSYTSGKWQYQMQINAAGTRSEGRWGWLTYDGKKLPRGTVNDYYDTPWGPIYWVDVPTTAWGLHGWMPIPLPQNPRKGKALAGPALGLGSSPAQPSTPASQPSPPTNASAPATPKVRTLEINKSHNGQLARLHVGNVMVVRLPGNPATGYQWQMAATNGPTMRMTVRPQYSPPASTAAGNAALGTYTFTFQAVQAGTGALRFYYARPNDPSHPRESFAVSVNVLPASSGAVTRPAALGAVR